MNESRKRSKKRDEVVGNNELEHLWITMTVIRKLLKFSNKEASVLQPFEEKREGVDDVRRAASLSLMSGIGLETIRFK